MAISLTEYATFAALRSVLLSWLPAGVEVIRAQQNRVPTPKGADFVAMLPVFRERLSTNVSSFPDTASRRDMQSTRVTVQLDIVGPNSADNAQVVSTLFRSEVAAAAFAATGADVAPLFAADPRQLPFGDGEQQTDERWVLDVVLQANVATNTPQDSAGTVTLTTVALS